MHDLGTRTLTTARLSLRRLAVDDAGQMHTNWAGDPEVTTYLTWQPHATCADTRDYLASRVAAYADPATYDWGIELRDTGQLIGDISVVEADDAIAMKTIGYCLGRPWWHRGYTSEALAAVISFLIEQVGANRVAASHDPRNVFSGRVMAACGMRYEGTLRAGDRSNQGLVDSAVYAILADDYFADHTA
ncbi:GNAT family N-acetyltransferase [Brooklawnia cerclae]|nr:GNAT family N-acetyltransferase [Brooklawnia cerclae]